MGLFKFRAFVSCLPLHLVNFGQEQSTPASAAGCLLLRFRAGALIVAAVVILCASTAAFYLWKGGDKNVSVNRGLFQSYCSKPLMSDI